MEYTSNRSSRVHYQVQGNQQSPSSKVFIEECRRLAVDSSLGKKFKTGGCLCCKCECGRSLDGVSTNVGKEPLYITCSNCGNVVYTDRTFLTTKYTHFIACLLSPIFCCFLPYYFNWCKYVRHNCPICKRYIGFSK